MGFSFSSAIAQDVMLSTAAAGLTNEHLLADDKEASLIHDLGECFAVCTDDVMHWSKRPEDHSRGFLDWILNGINLVSSGGVTKT